MLLAGIGACVPSTEQSGSGGGNQYAGSWVSFVITESQTSPLNLGGYIVGENGGFGVSSSGVVATGSFSAAGQVSGELQTTSNGCRYAIQGSCTNLYFCSGSLSRTFPAQDPGNFCRYYQFTTNR